MVVVCIWDLFVLYYSSRIFRYGHVTITAQQKLRIPCFILVHIMLAHFLISIKLLITRSTLVANTCLRIKSSTSLLLRSRSFFISLHGLHFSASYLLRSIIILNITIISLIELIFLILCLNLKCSLIRSLGEKNGTVNTEFPRIRCIPMITRSSDEHYHYLIYIFISLIAAVDLFDFLKSKLTCSIRRGSLTN